MSIGCLCVAGALIYQQYAKMRQQEREFEAKIIAVDHHIFEIPDKAEVDEKNLPDEEKLVSLKKELYSRDTEKSLVALAELWNCQDAYAIPVAKFYLSQAYRQNKTKNEAIAENKNRVVNILGSEQTHRNLTLLIPVAQDLDKGVRISVLKNLGKYVTQDVLPTLKEAVNDSDEEVRKIAEEELQRVQNAMTAWIRAEKDRLISEYASKNNHLGYDSARKKFAEIAAKNSVVVPVM